MTTVNKFSFENQNRANSLRDNMVDAIIDAVDFSPLATAGEIVAEYLGNKGLREYAHSQVGGIAYFEGGNALERLSKLVDPELVTQNLAMFASALRDADNATVAKVAAELSDDNHDSSEGVFGGYLSVNGFEAELLEVLRTDVIGSIRNGMIAMQHKEEFGK